MMNEKALKASVPFGKFKAPEKCCNCSGTGYAVCPYCLGNGIWQGKTCSHCGGKGLIDCPKCKGKGII